MKEFNFNNDITIYPNEKGWKRIGELLYDHYGADYAIKHVIEHTTKDGAYKDTLWVIIQDLHDMFYNGQSYFKHVNFLIEKH